MFKNIIGSAKWIYGNLKGFKLSVLFLTILLSVVSLSNIAIAVVSKKLVDAATSGDKKIVYGLLIAYSAFVISEIAVGAFNSFFNINIWQNLSIKIRIGLYRKLVHSDWLDFNKLHSGDYVSRFTQDTAAVTSWMVDDIPGILSSVIKFLAAFCVLVYYQPMIALFTFIFGPIAFVISRVYSRKLKLTYKSIQQIDSEINGKLQEYFHNIQIVKVYGLEEMSSRELEKIYKKRKGLIIKNSIRSNRMGIISSIGSWGGYFLAYSVGIFGIYTGNISFGVLVVFLQLFHQVQEPLSGLAGSIPKLTICLASVERLMELERLKKEEAKTVSEMPARISIKVRNVSFSYPGRENQLSNINFKADSGEMVLIMGKSGSGKTTLIRLILSLLTPSCGEIVLIDEIHRAVLANPGNRKWISYVPQGNSIFSGTIASNIRYGNPDATEDEIISALVSSEAWEFVSGLKDGIHSTVGERGNGISEGQAQRIAIARALVNKAPAVILDEVTSGLDPETERKVMENIRRNFSRKTFIVITHREAVKQYADRIYRMQNGSLIQELSEYNERKEERNDNKAEYSRNQMELQSS